jgi:hypothetical protein
MQTRSFSAEMEEQASATAELVRSVTMSTPSLSYQPRRMPNAYVWFVLVVGGNHLDFDARIAGHKFGRRLLRTGNSIWPIDVTVRPRKIGQDADFDDWRGTRRPYPCARYGRHRSAGQRGSARNVYDAPSV